jgi:hypothetical protein
LLCQAKQSSCSSSQLAVLQVDAAASYSAAFTFFGVQVRFGLRVLSALHEHWARKTAWSAGARDQCSELLEQMPALEIAKSSKLGLASSA